MATKREKQLTTLLLKERLERLTNKKVFFENSKVLKITFYKGIYGDEDPEPENFTKAKTLSYSYDNPRLAIASAIKDIKNYFIELEQTQSTGFMDQVERLNPATSTIDSIILRTGNWIDVDLS